MATFKGRRPSTIALDDAVSQGLVRFELRAAQDGVTSRTVLRIVSCTDRPLRVRVPRGTEFVPQGPRP